LPAPIIPKEEVIDRLLGVFRNSGFEGASLADLSAATGLGRSSLYHYFPGGKEEMARAVLDRVDAWLAAEVIGPLEAKGDPRRRLQAMTSSLNQFYAGGSERCIMGAFVVGSSLSLFAPRLAAAFERWISALAALARHEGVPAKLARERAEKVVAQVQGAVTLSAAFSDPRPFRRALAGLEHELLGMAQAA